MLMPIAYILIVVWIYLVWMVWKKKTNIFHDQMEPKLAERRLKRLKAFLLVAGIGVAAFWVNIILMIAIGGYEGESLAALFIAFFSFVLFSIGTIGGLVIFLKGRRKTT